MRIRREYRGDFDAASSALRESLGTTEKLGKLHAIESLAAIMIWRSDLIGAHLAIDQSLQLSKEIRSALGEANGIAGLAALARMRLQLHPAREMYEKAKRLYTQVGTFGGVAACLEEVAKILYLDRDTVAAQAVCNEALGVHRSVGSVVGEIDCIQILADVELLAGNLDSARRLYQETLGRSSEVGSNRRQRYVFWRIGEVLELQNDIGKASQNFQTAVSKMRSDSKDLALPGWEALLQSKLSLSPTDTARHIAVAKAHWQKIERLDLVRSHIDSVTLN